MIKVGELSGSLELSLKQAIKYLDESEALRTKIKRILLPNIGMFVGILIMLFVCVIVGVPVIQDPHHTKHLPKLVLALDFRLHQ